MSWILQIEIADKTRINDVAALFHDLSKHECVANAVLTDPCIMSAKLESPQKKRRAKRPTGGKRKS